jgi:hypothetical protein
MRAFLARRQHNSPILDIRVQWIARADIEAAAKRPWKNDLSLRGNFGLHGKTILPRIWSFRNRSELRHIRNAYIAGNERTVRENYGMRWTASCEALEKA